MINVEKKTEIKDNYYKYNYYHNKTITISL